MFQPGHATDRKPPFRFAVYTRVAFSDTDAQGVVYYGRYLPYFDLARTEYHRRLGEVGVNRAEFVMRASTVEYHAPARFDDLLEVFVRISRVGTTSVTYDYAAYKLEADERRFADGDRDPGDRPDRPRRPANAPGAGQLPRCGLVGRGDVPLSGAVEAIEAIVAGDGEADEILRAVVSELVASGDRHLGRDLLRRRRRARPGAGSGHRNPRNQNADAGELLGRAGRRACCGRVRRPGAPRARRGARRRVVPRRLGHRRRPLGQCVLGRRDAIGVEHGVDRAQRVQERAQPRDVADLGRVPVLRELILDRTAVGDDVRAVLGEGAGDVFQ